VIVSNFDIRISKLQEVLQGGYSVKVQSALLLRVSSPVDKDVDHPQFFDPPYPLKYLQAGLSKYPDVRLSLLDCWIQPKSVSEMVEQTAKIGPDLVVASASSFDVEVASGYVTALKRQEKAPLVIGIGQGYRSSLRRAFAGWRASFVTGRALRRRRSSGASLYAHSEM
jgi:hypothetical protein